MAHNHIAWPNVPTFHILPFNETLRIAFTNHYQNGTKMQITPDLIKTIANSYLFTDIWAKSGDFTDLQMALLIAVKKICLSNTAVPTWALRHGD